MTSPTRSVIEGFLDLVYPPKCLICETLNPLYICASCLSKIEPVPLPYCRRCGHPLYEDQCRDCHGRPRSFTVARAAGDYSGVLRQAIHRFKYQGYRLMDEPLARLLHEYLVKDADFRWRKADLIVSVPIHPIRQRVRGYNQSELLAARLSELTGLPLLRDAVARHRYTCPQVELSGDERRVNVKAAFRITRPDALTGKIILLVDDVSTTCSTIHECSLALLSAGALRVYALCLAFDA